MAKNYVQDGNTVTLAAPYAVNSGDGALVGSLFGVSLTTLANGVSGEFATRGVWDITALSTDTGTPGTKIYWDNTNKRCTTTSTSNTLIGCLTAAKANGETTMRVRLNSIVA